MFDIFLNYKPPKELRALFIVHYAPILLIILIGPLTILFDIWNLPLSWPAAFILGGLVFLLGSYVYIKWEMYWHKTYNGQLVTGGIFRYIRHPHYASLLIIGFGLAIFFNSIATIVIAVIAVPIMIWSIFDEEKLLIKQYGEEYKKFMKKTPWRIIPRFF